MTDYRARLILKQPCEVGINISILPMSKPQPKEIWQCAEVHMANSRQPGLEHRLFVPC